MLSVTLWLIDFQIRTPPDIERRHRSMYPSGTWRGHWDQAIYGRQPMGPLVLRFHDGQIDGEGRDIIGPFTFTGEYEENGVIRMVKQYHGKRTHQVFYHGTYDGEGTIFGE